MHHLPLHRPRLRALPSRDARSVAIACLAALAVACADVPVGPESTTVPARPAPTRAAAAASVAAATGGVVIETRGVESSTLAARVAALGGRVERRLPQLGVLVVGGLGASGVSSIAAQSDVARVTRDVRLRWLPPTTLRVAQASPRIAARPLPGIDQSNAFFFADFQWNLRVTRAQESWLTTPEGRESEVYVLDTGIDPTHQDLVGRVNVAKSVSFAQNELGDIKDYESHGTFVSGLITSNGLGVASVAPLATIVAVKVLDASGSGSFADVITGIVYAADQGADVINMSLGAIVDMNDDATRGLVRYLQAAIDYARSKGVVVVAAAGNDTLDLTAIPPQFKSVPAELAGVISVGATAPVNQMHFDMIASYSNFGSTDRPRDGITMFAPGGDLTAAGVLADLLISPCSQFSPFGCGPGSYLLGAGTSFASPMVAGEGAILRSIVGGTVAASNVNAGCIVQGTDPIGPSSIFGRGRMNVMKAAACARAGTTATRTLIAQNR